VVCAIEQTLIRVLQPTKINLAALGNMVPHLHWHVIARFDGDSHFPQTIWGAAQRQVEAPSRLLRVPPSELDRQMGLALQALASRA
jgi:diadenosine tetraphosphate (Ap4A) HIT family hydrolase